MTEDPFNQCLVVYDWSEEIEQNSVFGELLEFARETRLDMQFCSVVLPGASRARKMKVSDLARRLEEGEVMESIELYLGEKRPGRRFESDADAYVRISSLPYRRHCLVELPFGLFANDQWIRLIERLSHLGALTYGAAFNWRRKSSPAFHVVGISHLVAGPDGLVHVWPVSEEVQRQEYEEMLWRDERLSPLTESRGKMRHRLGYFRDVYEMNILNAAHVEKVVNGQSIGDIIRTTPGWGTLRELDNSNWLWTVDDTALGWIRQKFEQWRLLIRCL